MKIVYLTDQIYLHGGIEKILSQKVNYLAEKNGFEVYIITFNQKKIKPQYLINENVKLIDLNLNYIPNISYYHFKNIYKLFRHFIILKKTLNKIKPDVVISIQFFPDQYFLPFYKLKKTIKEIHFMGEAIDKGLNLLDKVLFRTITKKYSHLVLLNNDELVYYKSFKNLVVIPNFVDEIKLNADLKRKNIILTAGRIAPVKQFDHLIRAFSLIAHKHLDWQLHIYGDGDYLLRKSYDEIIQKKNLTNQIKIFEATNSINEKMQEAKIFGLTSSTECFPMVLLEAKVTGMAIISYDCPHGPRNIIIENEDGILSKPNDINEFANKLELLIKDEKQINLMSNNSKKNISKFSKEKIMNIWINLFKNE